MRIDLRQAKSEGTEMFFSPSAEELDLSIDGVGFPEPIEVNLTITKSGDEIIIEGRITASAELECSRCLEIYEMPVKLLIRFIIQLLDINQAQETSDDDFVILPKSVSEYDLTDRVREAIILEIPLKPLCSESCKGLCAMCGVNLNESDCDCTPDKTDERWDALKQLFGEI
jgi:uncharacterized protein